MEDKEEFVKEIIKAFSFEEILDHAVDDVPNIGDLIAIRYKGLREVFSHLYGYIDKEVDEVHFGILKEISDNRRYVTMITFDDNGNKHTIHWNFNPPTMDHKVIKLFKCPFTEEELKNKKFMNSEAERRAKPLVLTVGMWEDLMKEISSLKQNK